MVLVNASSGISGELNEGARGGMVDGAESKTLAENHSKKGVLSEGIRVSDGELNTKNVINGNRKEPVESGRVDIGDTRVVSQNRGVEVRSQSNKWGSWESWGVMNMVGRVLGGNLSVDDDDDDVEDVNNSLNGSKTNVVEERESILGDKSDYESTVVDKVTLEDVKTSEIGREVYVVANGSDVESIVADKVKLEAVNSSEIVREAIVVADKDTGQGVVGEPTSVNKSDIESIAVEHIAFEDVNTSKNGHQADVVEAKDACQGVIGEPESVDKRDVESIIVDKVTSEDAKRSKNGHEADKDVWQGVDRISVDIVMLEETNTSENGCEADEDKDKWQGAIGETTSVNKSDVESIEANEVMLESVNTSKNGCQANVVVDKEASGEPTYVNKSNVECIVVDKVALEDVNTSENGREADVVTGKDTWQGMIRKAASESKGDFEKIVPDQDSDDLVEGTGLKVNHQDSVSNELVPTGMLKTDEVNDVEFDTFSIPKTRGEHQITEKEGDYYVSDLVWGKVKSHPWWPGQIFPPMAASVEAAKHFRKQSYLIAYFGDRSFAWNEGANIKPFRSHFSQMEKQSNSDGLCHAVNCALDEVTRRIEFGLLCPCLSEEVRDKIKTQVVSNPGILEDNNIVDGVDQLSGPAPFLPGMLLQFLQSVSGCPKSKTDRLQFTIAKAQLLSFNRWKGHHELPVFEQYFGLLEADGTRVTQVTQVTQDTVKEEEGSDSKKRKSTSEDGSSQKRKHPSGEKDFPTTKEKCISALFSSSNLILPNVDEKPVKRPGRRPGPYGKYAPRVKRHRSLLQTSPIGDGKNNSELRISEESELVEIIPDEIPTPEVILSKIILAVKVPMQGFSILISEVDFLREFRNLICLENKPGFRDAEMDKGKQPARLETADTSGFEGTEDSYWTDMIIQGYSQEPVLFEPANPDDMAVQVKEEADIKGDTVVEYQPTALILNFTNLDSIPDLANLNEIFGRYGPVMETETEILRKSKRVKVIFKRQADAETAFSSTGKYSIFGPSLVSYRLQYDSTPRKSRVKRNKDTSLKGNA